MLHCLSEREHRVLEIVDKLRICRANDLAWLAGYTDFTYCRKCLKKLEEMRFVQTTRDSRGAKCYYLTSRGLTEVGKPRSHTYELSSTTNHALTVTKVCTWICATNDACIFDMVTDSGSRRKYASKAHCPDIIYNGIAYEVELNHKKRSVLEANVLDNRQFRQQIWIVPDSRNSIYNNLLLAAKVTATQVDVMKLSAIDEALSTLDIHHNQYHSPTGITTAYEAPVPPAAKKYDAYFRALEDRK